MVPHFSLPFHAAAPLFSQLIKALHDESEALIANDAAGLAEAESRKRHLLMLLAPQASALRKRHGENDALELFARHAAQPKVLNKVLDKPRAGNSL